MRKLQLVVFLLLLAACTANPAEPAAEPIVALTSTPTATVTPASTATPEVTPTEASTTATTIPTIPPELLLTQTATPGPRPTQTRTPFMTDFGGADPVAPPAGLLYSAPDGQTYLVDDEGIDALIQAGLEVQVSKTKTATALRSMLVKLQDDISDHNITKRSPSGHLAIGGERLVQIAVPDLPLMYIDEVMVLTDCCTDELQSMLNDGWRILAVCPPNSTRRPDYVVGRRKTKDVS